MKNEITSKKAASAAGTIWANTKGVPDNYRVVAVRPDLLLAFMVFLSNLKMGNRVVTDLCLISQLRTAVASDLTQAKDQKKKLKKGR